MRKTGDANTIVSKRSLPGLKSGGNGIKLKGCYVAVKRSPCLKDLVQSSDRRISAKVHINSFERSIGTTYKLDKRVYKNFFLTLCT